MCILAEKEKIREIWSRIQLDQFHRWCWETSTVVWCIFYLLLIIGLVFVPALNYPNMTQTGESMCDLLWFSSFFTVFSQLGGRVSFVGFPVVIVYMLMSSVPKCHGKAPAPGVFPICGAYCGTAVSLQFPSQQTDLTLRQKVWMHYWLPDFCQTV